MFDVGHFSEQAQDIAERSLKLIESLSHTEIDTEHLLLALIEQPDGTVSKILERMAVDAGAIRHKLAEDLRITPRYAPVLSVKPGQVFVTTRVQHTFEAAAKEAKKLGDALIAPEHILLGILKTRQSSSARYLGEAGVKRDAVVEAIRTIRADAGKVRSNTDANMFDRFTEPAKDAAQRSIEILHRYGHPQIDTEHILLALIEQPQGTVVPILDILMVDADELRQRLDRVLTGLPRSSMKALKPDAIYITPHVKTLFDRAQREAAQLGDKQIAPEHIFLGLLTGDGSHAAGLLGDAGVSREVVLEVLAVIRANTFGQG